MCRYFFLSVCRITECNWLREEKLVKPPAGPNTCTYVTSHVIFVLLFVQLISWNIFKTFWWEIIILSEDNQTTSVSHSSFVDYFELLEKLAHQSFETCIMQTSSKACSFDAASALFKATWITFYFMPLNWREMSKILPWDRNDLFDKTGMNNL